MRPTVDIVMWRALKPRSSWIRRTAPPGGVVVRERFAHPHEDDVRETAGRGGGSGPNHLFDDLSGRQVSAEPLLSGRAEPAGHGTASLTAHTDRRAIGVVHQHRLDRVSVGESPQPLLRLSIIGNTLDAGVQSRRQERSEVGAQIGRERRDVLDRKTLAVEALPELVHTIFRMVGEQLAELFSGEVVTGEFVSTAHGSSRRQSLSVRCVVNPSFV